MSLTYFSDLLTGWFGSDLTRTILLTGTFFSEAAVAGGILLKSSYKTCRNWAAVILVVGGVCAGVFFTLVLFANDESISSAQQSKIIDLETRLIEQQDLIASLIEASTPRTVLEQSSIAQTLSPLRKVPTFTMVGNGFETADFALYLESALGSGGFKATRLPSDGFIQEGVAIVFAEMPGDFGSAPSGIAATTLCKQLSRQHIEL